MTTLDDIQAGLAALSPDDQARVRDYVAFLRWRAAQAEQAAAQAGARPWRLNLLEHLADADVRSTREAAGMEVKVAEARVGGEARPGLWEHPPVRGEAVVEFHVPVPAGLRNLRLITAIGIREGTQPRQDRLVAFRVRLDGWQVWSRAAWPTHWEPAEVPLPMQAGDVMRLAFATDGLGDHEWAWAVWGEPVLTGIEDASPT